MTQDPILSVRGLQIRFGLRGRTLHAIRDIDLDLYRGEVLALVGESGSGKSVFTKSFMGLLDANGSITGGSIDYYPTPGCAPLHLAALKTEKEWLAVRGREIAMVMQDPMTSLNPLKTIGEQITEAVTLHQGLKGAAAREKTLEYLRDVGIPDPALRYKQYPHEFSGGMRQRVVIAIALACNPKILLCDEPTTALDVTIQAQILQLLRQMRAKYHLTIVLITHQMQVVKDICTDLAVMSHGKVVDDGSILDVFDHPSNELTREFIYTSGNMNKGITLVQEHPLFSKERESGSVYLLFSVGSGAEETLMADIRERFGVRGNIMFGNVDVIHGTPVGMILVSLDGPAEAVSKALAYFPTVGVSATPLADLHVNEVEENDNE